MKVLFFGIYDIGVYALDALISGGIDIVEVITKPDTDNEIQPVALWASKKDLVYFQPVSLKDPNFLDLVYSLEPDLIVVSGYHQVIPPSILKIPSWGTINLHGSLLPEYRGPNPHKWAIVKGEEFTGVTVHMMTPNLDDGDILTQQVVPIDEWDTGESLLIKTSQIGAKLLAETINRIKTGKIFRRAQDETRASYFGYPTKDDSRIGWGKEARTIRNLIMGFSPRPGAWTSFNDYSMIVKKAQVCNKNSVGEPGEIVAISDKLRIATATFDVEISDLTIENQPAMSFHEIYDRLGIRVKDRLI